MPSPTCVYVCDEHGDRGSSNGNDFPKTLFQRLCRKRRGACPRSRTRVLKTNWRCTLRWYSRQRVSTKLYHVVSHSILYISTYGPSLVILLSIAAVLACLQSIKLIFNFIFYMKTTIVVNGDRLRFIIPSNVYTDHYVLFVINSWSWGWNFIRIVTTWFSTDVLQVCPQKKEDLVTMVNRGNKWKKHKNVSRSTSSHQVLPVCQRARPTVQYLGVCRIFRS